MATVVFDRVCKVYARGETPAVDGFSLDVEDGEFLVLVGGIWMRLVGGIMCLSLLR